MKSDLNKGITNIVYNHLNLPTEIVFSGTGTKKINYIYNAAGVKVQKKVTNGTSVMTTDYLDGFQYFSNVLQFFPTAEGYVKNTVVSNQNTYDYKYNGKEWQDELGLNMYDMDMRMYDPAIARWVVMDPVIHHSLSPYNAFDNNPVY